MNPEEFRAAGYRMVDWLAEYMSNVDKYPVLSEAKPGWVRSQLPDEAPEQGEPLDAIVRDLDSIVMPGITHWQSPNFFGYFPANTSGPSILAEMVSAGLGVQGMLWLTSPACTELETHMLDWVVDLMGLPVGFSSRGAGGGVIQDSASSAVVCALLAARERATGGESNREGVRAPLTVYATDQAHSSVDKAVRIAGIGSDNIRRVATEGELAMSPESLDQRLAEDRAVGLTPCMVVATIGTTSTGAVDPIRQIAEVCGKHGVWLHVDAAMAGSAAICPEFRHIFDGMEGADSFCFNPHKWLPVNFDCDCFYVRDRAALVNALSILPEYLRNTATESGAVIDYRDWQIPLGRRFRSLKLWFVLRSYGAEALREMIRRHVVIAHWLDEQVRNSDNFEIAAPTVLQLVCFRHVAGDEATEQVMRAINESGRAFLTHAKVNGQFVLRLSVGGVHTELRHVQDVWRMLQDAARTVESEAVSG
jgi:aromatic-L-amino-acid decarboxylase